MKMFSDKQKLRDIAAAIEIRNGVLQAKGKRSQMEGQSYKKKERAQERIDSYVNLSE